MTLIELLVVVSIMMLLVMIAVPRMKPGLENRRIREAARAINVYLNSARNRAIENGRPWGVAILRDANSPLSGASLVQVETPEAYGGDVATASMRLMNATPVGAFPGATVLRAQVHMGDMSRGLLRWGDLIRLNYQGPLYRIVDDPTDNTPPNTPFPPATNVGFDFPLNPPDVTKGFIDFSVGATDANGWITDQWLTLVAADNQIHNVPWYTGAWPPPPISQAVFTVYRQPVPSSVPPLLLPNNVVIDLWYSGIGLAQFSNVGSGPTSRPITTIMFNSTGSVDQVAAHNLGGAIRALEPIYLMVGRRDRVDPAPAPSHIDPTGDLVAVAEDRVTNLADLMNLWVAVNPQTGYVACSEMAQSNAASALAVKLTAARGLAREFQSKGGR
jgi:type II secretory pathway pseudopilin PulG